MQQERDEIIRLDNDYSGNTWRSISIERLHDVCKLAIQHCLQQNKPLAFRFQMLRSQMPLEKKDERQWLLDLLEAWYTKKWNNKRRGEGRNASTPKKRKAPVCGSCGETLHCLVCDGVGVQVRFPLQDFGTDF
jgi:hypothetical protein